MGFLAFLVAAIGLELAGICALAQAPIRAPGATYRAPDSPDAPETSAKTLEARLAEARAALAAAATLDDAALSNAPAGVLPQDLSLRRPLLQRLVRLYEQQLGNAAELETTRTRKAELIREAQAWTRFAERPPYSILLTDRLREESQTVRLKISNFETAAAALEQLIQENRKSIGRTEERIRQINEQLESSSNPTVSARLVWQRDMERLRNQVSAATVAVLDLERLLGREVVAGSRIRLDLLQRQIAIADVGTKFTQADLDQATSQIEIERGQLEGELAEVQTRRDAVVRTLASAREELRLLQARPDASPPATAKAAGTVSARVAQLETIDTASRVLRLLLEAGNLERTMWEMRFAASESGNSETLRESSRRLGAVIGRVALWREHERQQAEVFSSQIQLQEKRLNDLAPDSDLIPLARERLAALRESDQFLRRLSRAIEGLQRQTQRWQDGLRAAEVRLPLAARVQNLFSDTRLFLKRLWLFELFVVEDTITVDGQKITGKRSVTVSKIVMAAFILVGGIWLTGLLSRLMEPIIVRRFKIERNQASLIRRWLRAAMVVCLVLFSLVSAKIPLTAFAFAGGALAIGLGFGTQTILKNFVSGLILLFERPFQVGDILDVGGQKGMVNSIGLRASVLELWDGTETLIPNSFLLENNVTNWTYTHRKVRFPVTVGVAYGSDPRRVIQLLDEVAARHGLVEKEPKALVLLTEFGDSAMMFELRYWVDVVKASAAQVSSDLRLMIAASFGEHGIVIAFPQRDLHLHASQPILVDVVPADSRAKDIPNPKLPESSDKQGTIP